MENCVFCWVLYKYERDEKKLFIHYINKYITHKKRGDDDYNGEDEFNSSCFQFFFYVSVLTILLSNK